MTPTPARPTPPRPLERTRTLASLATLLLALGSSASAQQAETFTGVLAMDGKPVFPKDVIKVGDGIVTVHESALTIELEPRRNGDRLFYKVSGSGRLLYSYSFQDADGGLGCMDLVDRTIEIDAIANSSGTSGSGVQMPFLGGFIRYQEEARQGDARRLCTPVRPGKWQKSIDGLLTNERSFEAEAAGRPLSERFLALYPDRDRPTPADLEKRLRRDPTDWGPGLLAVLSSSSDLVEGESMRSIHPVIRRLDGEWGGTIVSADGGSKTARIGDEIMPGDNLVVWDDTFAVVRFPDGSTVAMEANQPMRRSPSPDADGRYRYSDVIAGEPFVFNMTKSTHRYGVFRNGPSGGQRVQRFFVENGRLLYKLGRGLKGMFIEPESRSRFEAETNSVIVGVEGTVFRLIDSDGTTTIQVQEGVVEVTPRSPGATPAYLEAGNQVTVAPYGPGAIEPYGTTAEDRRTIAILDSSARDPSGDVADGGPGAVPGRNEPAPPTGGSEAGSLPGAWRIELVPLRGVRRAGRAELAGQAGIGHVTIVWDDGGTSTGYLGESGPDLAITLPYDRPTYPRILNGRMDAFGQRLSGAILDSEDRKTGTWTATRLDAAAEPVPRGPARPATRTGPAAMPPSGGRLLFVDRPTFSSTETVVVRWTGLPGNRRDWVSVISADEPDDKYGSWAYTDGKKDGQFSVPRRLTPGIYEARVYFDWPNGKFHVEDRIRFRVVNE